ncbi:MAG: hypothetical protein MUC83_19160, partial [Pirellula sp.]|nr:hypothetical protein [Pirellula sp.]
MKKITWSTGCKVVCFILGTTILASFILIRSTHVVYVSPEIRGMIEVSNQDQDVSAFLAQIRVYVGKDIEVFETKVTKEGRFFFDAVQRKMLMLPVGGDAGFATDLSIFLDGHEVG